MCRLRSFTVSSIRILRRKRRTSFSHTQKFGACLWNKHTGPASISIDDRKGLETRVKYYINREIYEEISQRHRFKICHHEYWSGMGHDTGRKGCGTGRSQNPWSSGWMASRIRCKTIVLLDDAWICRSAKLPSHSNCQCFSFLISTTTKLSIFTRRRSNIFDGGQKSIAITIIDG